MTINGDEDMKVPILKSGWRLLGEDGGGDPIEDQPNVYVITPNDDLDGVKASGSGSVLGAIRKFLWNVAKSESSYVVSGPPEDSDWNKAIFEGDFPSTNIEDSGGREVMEGFVVWGRDRSLLAKTPWEGGHYPPFNANKSPPLKGYINAMGAAADNVVGTNGLQALPNMGMGQSAGISGMQQGAVILMFAACYMLYKLLKKPVCSLSCGWKDKDDGDLELGRLQDA